MAIVLNWLWQGAIVALAAAAVVRAIAPSRAQARYCALWTACTAILVLPAMPLLSPALPVPATAAALSSVVPTVEVPIAWWTSPAAAAAALLMWCVASLGRMALTALAFRRARAQFRDFPRDREARLRHWMRVRATGRRTRLVMSTNVRAAAVLGCGSPVIAVAPALLDHLTDADLDRIVIHEWAHVQRGDDLAHIGHAIIRTAAGWHPALCWLERQLHVEREVACDQIAAQITGSVKQYAACLVTVAGLPRVPRRTLPALAAASSSGLRRRIVRMLSASPAASAGPWQTSAFRAGVVFAVLAVAVGSIEIVEIAAAPAPVAAFVQALPRRPPVRVQPEASAETRRRAPVQVEWRAPVDDGSPVPPLVSRPIDAIAVSAPLPPVAADVESPLEDPVQSSNPWEAPVDAGIAVARSSENAAAATAGFFTRFGRKIAGSF